MAPVLARKIRSGGKGTWGQVGMPAMSQVSEAEALQLANWILQLR
jgi:cytochrome c